MSNISIFDLIDVAQIRGLVAKTISAAIDVAQLNPKLAPFSAIIDDLQGELVEAISGKIIADKTEVK